jgi:hypothetical protein
MAFIIGWRFTLLLMAIFPFMLVLGAMLGAFFGGNVHAEMNAYA